MSRARGRRRVLAGGPGSVPSAATAAEARFTPSVDPQRWSAIVLVVLAVLGIGVAGYLTAVHYANVPLACSDSGLVNCQRVLSSQYSVVPGTQLPITVPGMLFFIASLGLGILQLRRPQDMGLRRLHAVLGGLGLAAALYLVFVELIELGNICLFCSSVHLLLLLTFLTTIWRLFPPRALG